MKQAFTLLRGTQSILLATLVSAACQAIAADNTLQTTAGARQEIGTVQSVLDEFSMQNKNVRSGIVRSVQGHNFGVAIKHHYSQNDVVSISGVDVDEQNSTFVLKGNSKSLQGFKINYRTKTAVEYSTDARGVVSAKVVPIAQIVPDFHPDWMKASGVTSLLAAVHPTYSTMAQRQAVHIGPYANEDVTKLQSRPGSSYVFFLDNRPVMSGSTPLNGVSKENMYRMWQVVAGIYSPYNLNITTDPAVYAAAKAANVARTGIILFYNQDGRSNAPLWSFGSTSAGTLYRNPSSGFDYGYGIGMTAAHEVGHQMGMNHDRGGSGGEYFEGIAAYQWGPIMGNYWMGSGWANSLWTWSKGEYSTATNFEDDLRSMNATDAVPYMVDDNVSGKPLNIDGAGNISPQSNFGQIEKTGDTDAFTFTVGATGGSLNLKIDPLEYFGMLDVSAKIINSAGITVATSNMPVNRRAEFVNVSLASGNYSVVIAGGAEGTPSNGFSNYSSLGYYGIQGTLSGSVVVPPTEITLLNNTSVAVSGASGANVNYSFVVPAGAPNLSIRLSGGSGDGDIYVQRTVAPTTTSYLAKSDGATNTESIQIPVPTAGTYKILFNASSAVSGASLVASIDPASAGNVLVSGTAVPITLALNATKTYRITLPAGKTNLTFKLSGGTGDGDIFEKISVAPTTTVYDKKSDGATNTETITVSSPVAGTYYLLVKAYAAVNGASLVATVQ